MSAVLGFTQRRLAASFDHHVGALHKPGCNLMADFVPGLEIYDELKHDRLFYWRSPVEGRPCLNPNRVSTSTPADSNAAADLYAFDALYGLAQTFYIYHSQTVLTSSHHTESTAEGSTRVPQLPGALAPHLFGAHFFWALRLHPK